MLSEMERYSNSERDSDCERQRTEAAAKRALDYDGSDMGGLFLKIQPYKSTKPKKASNFTPAIMKGYNRIYVGNLSWEITEDELRKLFLGCNISAIRFGKDKETAPSCCYTAAVTAGVMVAVFRVQCAMVPAVHGSVTGGSY
ncbi:hypothetical protein C3L33_22400, partial [Rhododendron williamsianum]